jgi:hypothetical protein
MPDTSFHPDSLAPTVPKCPDISGRYAKLPHYLALPTCTLLNQAKSGALVIVIAR